MVRAGEVPVRLSGIDDLVWGLLEKCWSRVPGERPTVTEVSTTFSNLSSRPKVNHAPRRQIAMGGALERNPSLTPSKLELQLRGIRFSQDQPRGRRFYVKLKYGMLNFVRYIQIPYFLIWRFGIPYFRFRFPLYVPFWTSSISSSSLWSLAPHFFILS